MWSRKELKSKAKKTIANNRINIIIACLIIAIVGAGYNFSRVDLNISKEIIDLEEDLLDTKLPPNVSQEIFNELGRVKEEGKNFVERIDRKYTVKNATKGVVATIISNSGPSRSVVLGIINSINKFVFDNKILEGTIVAIITFLSLLFWIFVQNILIVGESRFLLETKNYNDSNLRSLFFIYRVGKTLRTAWIMFLRGIFTFLWSLTIVGGFIKYYSYRMIPFILAENPSISSKDAFQLSKDMMRGNKWATFKLDMSFMPWNLLSIGTLGLVGIVYSNPYRSTTKSELYYYLREELLEAKNPLALEYLRDTYLLNRPEKLNEDGLAIYPSDKYLLEEVRRIKINSLKYDRRYSLVSLVYIFIGVAFIGWCWEVFLYLFTTGKFVNRGTLRGPWLPIYGVGSVVVLVVLKKFRDKPGWLFVTSFFLCGLIEYIGSWMLEMLFNKRWWDYSNVFLNINGRVCLEGLLFFATGCSLIVYLIAPFIDDLVEKIPVEKRSKIATILLLAFALDLGWSIFEPNQGRNITISLNEKPYRLAWFKV